MPRNRGITLIELLLVIALIMIIGGLGSPFLTRFLVENNYQTSVDKIISTIRKAQMYSLTGKNGSVWGICFISGSNIIRMYRGTCASPLQKDDFDIPSTITVSGLSDTTFSLMRGEPTQSLTISVSSNVGSTTISLNRGGGLTITNP